MLAPLTARQREVLEFVRQFMTKARYPPTVREIGAHFGFVPRSVFDQLKALERKGYLRRDAAKSRSLQILETTPGAAIDHPPSVGTRHSALSAPPYRELPILGRVAAGQPLLSDQNLEGTSVVPHDWVSADEAFLLKVQVDSMIDAHISVQTVLDSIVVALRDGDKIELRGFGPFRLRVRRPRQGRNPKTGTRVDVPGKAIPYFKPGKELRDLLNPGGGYDGPFAADAQDDGEAGRSLAADTGESGDGSS